MNNMPLILPACYLPPVAYFSAIHHTSSDIIMERFEHYPKQTYRSRTSIYSANGKLDLIIPIQHSRNGHVSIKDTRISYDWNWQRLHWMSLQTAYRSSAYFEFFEDDFAPFYQQRYEWLFDFNLAQLELLMRLFRIERSVSYTTHYVEKYDHAIDLRNAIHPKRVNSGADQKPYYQVFGDNHGFLPNLSVVDLLFNHGGQSKSYL